MPLFGKKKESAENQDWYPAAQPMIEWASSVPRVDLAVELMGIFGKADRCTIRDVYARMFGLPIEVPLWRGDPKLATALDRVDIPVHEALQLLEHAELVYGCSLYGLDIWVWRATRLGLATMDNGKHAVRQRIKDRTGL